MSGITWSPGREQYYVVGDEGFVFVFDKELNHIKSRYIGKYDFEGITYNSERDSLYCLDERNLLLVELGCDELDFLNVQRLDLDDRRKYNQFESLVYTGEYFSPANSFLTIGTRETGKKARSTIFSFTIDNLEMEPLMDIPLEDLSGLTIKGDRLILISDSADEIYTVSLQDETIDTDELPGDHQEGIHFREETGFVIADESENLFIIESD